MKRQRQSRQQGHGHTKSNSKCKVYACWVIAVGTLVTAAGAQEVKDFRPVKAVPGVIRLRGDRAVLGVMQALETEYVASHPGVRFENALQGSATGMAGITTGIADITLLGRPVTANEVIGFEWVHRVKPTGVRLMNGAMQGDGKSPALAVMVSRANPVTELTLDQLRVLMGCSAGGTKRVVWGDVGARGRWAARPVHAYVYDNQTGTGAWLMQRVQGERDCWNWDVVHEFKEGTVSAAEQIAAALRHDPEGIAVTTVQFAEGSKVLPINGVALSRETVRAGTYPLARGIYAYVNKSLGKPVETQAGEFLRWVLSPEGQRVVEREGEFVGLSEAMALSESARLQ